MKAAVVTVLAVICTIAGPVEARGRDRQAEAALEAASRTPVTSHIDGEQGAPQFIRGEFPFPGELSKRAVARQFLEGHRAFLGIPASHGFEITRVFEDGDNTVVRVSQHVNGIPIFGSDVAINISAANEVRVVSGQFYAADFDTLPSLDRDAAIAAARAALGEPALTAAPSAALEGYVRHEFGLLTWHVVLNATEPDGAPAEWNCFIDAHDGSLVDLFNGILHLLDRETYDLENGGAGSSAALIISEGGTSNDKVAQATHDNVGIVYDYFLSAHGRDSIDGAGGTIETYVHWGIDRVGALYGRNNGRPAMAFGDGNLHSAANTLPYGTVLDIVAHEYTHGVTDFSAHLGGTEQSRTLNESMSDVFAMLVDADDFLLGEDLFKGQQRALESIENPPFFGAQPDHMSRYQLDAPLPVLDPHKNGGITNKAFFNIVSAIGRPDAGKIYYRALTVYMTSSTGFIGARLALEQAAADLFGPASPQLAAVQSGFAAVGIVPPPADFEGVFVADSRTPSVDSNGAVTMTYTHPGASAMKLVFGTFRFPGRTVYIKDRMGTVVYDYRFIPLPPGANFTTGPVHGDTITVEYFPLPSNGWPSVDGYVHGDLDFAPPLLSTVSIDDIDHFSATVLWRTDEPADSQVDYGESVALGSSTPRQPFRTFNHSVDLTALQPGTTVHVLATSADFAGNQGDSGDLVFSTPAASDAVSISRARRQSGVLRVDATSTDPTSTLSVHFPSGFPIGAMEGDGKGGYRFRIDNFANSPSRDLTIVVRSSSGGSDSWIIPAEVSVP